MLTLLKNSTVAVHPRGLGRNASAPTVTGSRVDGTTHNGNNGKITAAKPAAQVLVSMTQIGVGWNANVNGIHATMQQLMVTMCLRRSPGTQRRSLIT